jgi:hypothetical protein
VCQHREVQRETLPNTLRTSLITGTRGRARREGWMRLGKKRNKERGSREAQGNVNVLVRRSGDARTDHGASGGTVAISFLG